MSDHHVAIYRGVMPKRFGELPSRERLLELRAQRDDYGKPLSWVSIGLRYGVRSYIVQEIATGKRDRSARFLLTHAGDQR